MLNSLLATYNALERPVANESDPLVVKFGLTLQQIIDVVSVPRLAFSGAVNTHKFIYSTLYIYIYIAIYPNFINIYKYSKERYKLARWQFLGI